MTDNTYWELHAQAVAAFHEAKLADAEATLGGGRWVSKYRRLFKLADRAYCNWAAVRLERGSPSGVEEGLSRVLGCSEDAKARQLASYSLAAHYHLKRRFRGARLYAE